MSRLLILIPLFVMLTLLVLEIVRLEDEVNNFPLPDSTYVQNIIEKKVEIIKTDSTRIYYHGCIDTVWDDPIPFNRR